LGSNRFGWNIGIGAVRALPRNKENGSSWLKAEIEVKHENAPVTSRE
jgi:hypothetical protein